MLLPPDPPKKENKKDKEGDDEEQQEEEEEPLLHINLIWDEEEIGDDDDDDDDDIMEEACVGHDYNIHNKGSPKLNDSSSTKKTNTKKNTMKTSTSKHTSTDKSLEKEKEVISRKSLINLDLTQKILSDVKLYYDVVEYLKKMKDNIIVIELCKIVQGSTTRRVTIHTRPSGCGSW